ncbi:MAG: DsbA family protein [Sphingomicrobium sp.]
MVRALISPILFATVLALTAAVPVAAKTVAQPAEDAPVAEWRRFFTEDPDAPMIAPAGYDVTIIEYFDYQCPACRASHEPLKQLLAKDRKVRLIFRDWPIFGPASERSALLAIASKYQSKYVAFHDALFDTPRPLDEDKIKAAAKKAGVDWAQLQKDGVTHAQDIKELLARNNEQAEMIGLDGTPGFIIGNVQSFGGRTLAQFEVSVKEARKGAGAATPERAKH